MTFRHLTTSFVALSAVQAVADPVVLSGSIGPYAIEVELSRAAQTDDTLSGRYRYAGKTAWLDLQGTAYDQDVVALTERADGKETGYFFLDVTGTALKGYWVSGETEYPVEITSEGKSVSALLSPDSPPDVSASLTGQYTTGGYWVNTWWAPRYEVGFNGGAVNVAVVDDGNLLIHFDFVVGPTYHLATFRGTAQRVGPNEFEHNAVLEGSSDPCRLTFRFDQGALSVSDQNNGFACQFGARAHANFDLIKTSDTAEFEDYR